MKTAEPTASVSGAPGAPGLLGVRLSVMMFLQYAMMGIWVPILARYLGASRAEGGLGFTGGQIGMIIGLAGAIGALMAPFAGQIADRWFSTERLMAVLIIVSGVIKWATAYQTTFAPWLLLSIAYSVVFVPTLALSNSLAFAHMTDSDKQFPVVRVWGTLGWIAVAWVFPMVWLQSDLRLSWMPPFLMGKEMVDVTHRLVDSLKGAGILSVVYGLYCLTLPHTPPKREAPEPLAFLKAFRMCRLPSFAVLMAAGFVISVIHSIYFMQTAPFLKSIGVRDADILPAMSLGQFAEIAVMAVLGLLLKRLGFRRVLSIGAAAYVLRYAIFGTTFLPVWIIVASQALHGVCFACFLAASFIYVDRVAPADVRHSVQTVFGMALGCGPLVGGWLNGTLARTFARPDKSINYAGFWYTTGCIALVAVLAVAIAFRDQTKGEGATGKPGSLRPAPPAPDNVPGSVPEGGGEHE